MQSFTWFVKVRVIRVCIPMSKRDKALAFSECRSNRQAVCCHCYREQRFHWSDIIAGSPWIASGGLGVISRRTSFLFRLFGKLFWIFQTIEHFLRSRGNDAPFFILPVTI